MREQKSGAIALICCLPHYKHVAGTRVQDTLVNFSTYLVEGRRRALIVQLGCAQPCTSWASCKEIETAERAGGR